MTTNGLPPNWTRVQLRELIDGFEAGRNLRAHGRPAADDEYGVLKVSAVSWGRFQPTENKALLPGDVPRSREFVRQGDLLISRANTTELVGAVVRVEGEHPRLMLPDKILRLCVRERITDPTFLMFALRLPSVRTHFEANATGTSDSMRNLSQPKIESAPVLLPPLNEQRRIVAKLEALQARSRRAREALDTVPALLEKLRQSILAAAFRGDLTKDWRAKHPDVEPASELLKRIRSERRKRWEESELARLKAKGKPPTDDKWKAKYKEPDPVDTTGLPELPEGWCWASSGEICESIVPNRDKPESFTGDIPWVTLPCLGQSVLAELDGVPGLSLDEIATSRARVIPQNAVIMSCVGRFGLACLLPKNSVINQQLHAFIAPAGLLPEYLVFALRSQAHYMLAQSSATTIAYMNKDKCNSVPIALSSTAEQHEVTRRIERGFAVIASSDAGHAFVSTRLRNLEQTILAKAFRGELVPQDPNDEPADAMLARLARAGESGASA